MLGEPNPTAWDVRFQLLGIPVRVHPFFWLAGLILGGGSRGGELLIWVAALFVSILVHELGHALMMQRFGIGSHIVLYMMGGLAIPDGPRWGRLRGDARESVLISLAGPGAGFALAALVVAGILLSGGEFRLRLENFPRFFQFRLGMAIDSDSWYALIGAMLYINIFWGLVNLLPVYPLDGGQVARALFVQADPWGGVIKSLWLSVIVGAVVAVWGLSQQPSSIFMAILFGTLAFQSYLAIQQQSGGGWGGGSPW